MVEQFVQLVEPPAYVAASLLVSTLNSEVTFNYVFMRTKKKI